jgi:hypothetical protein
VLQKENEWKEKVSVMEKDYNKKIETLTKDVEQAQNDKQLISKSYESQLQMMSEHIVELSGGGSGKKPGQGRGPGGGGMGDGGGMSFSQ